MFDISNALALERSDFTDGPATRNPPKAGRFKRREYRVLHDKNRGRLWRGPLQMFSRTPPLKKSVESELAMLREKAAAETCSTTAKLLREEAR